MRIFRIIAIAAAICLLIAAAVFALDVIVTNAPYNAAGNGTTNDRAAIQSAIDAVNAAGGGKVTLPGGYTFLAGNLDLKSNVTFEILGTLQQSNTISHYSQSTSMGKTHCGAYNWCDWYFFNYPIIYGASGVNNVTVKGPGTIRAAWGGSGGSTIFCALIGFWKVTNFTIQDLTMANAGSYHVAIWGCTGGTISRVTTRNPNGESYNGDGFSIQNDQNIVLDHDSCIGTSDDACYIWSAYNDPRHGSNGAHNSGGWWNADNPQASRNIEIKNCYFSPRNTKAFAFFPWGNENPDKSKNEISNIYVHDNAFGISAGAWSFCLQTLDEKGNTGCVPMSNITFVNNTYGSPQKEFQNSPTITDCVLDFTGWNGTLVRPSTFQNAGFETNGTPYWSLMKNSNSASAGAKNDAVSQTGAWYGFIDQLADGDAKIYQGLYLPANTYTFAAKVQSSGATAQLMALTKNNTVLAAKNFSNTSWADQCVSFTTSGTDIVRLGIQRGAATGGWARIDDARLVTGNSCAMSAALPSNTGVSAGATPKAGSLVYNLQGKILCRIAPAAGKACELSGEGAGVFCIVCEKGKFGEVRLVRTNARRR